jgi:hypothetical protein
VIDEVPSCVSRKAHLFRPKHFRADDVTIGFGKGLGVGSDHLSYDPRNVDVADPALRRDLAVTQDGDEVADSDQLLQPVRNIDDRNTARLQVRNDPKQDLHLGRTQCRGRLIHDEDPGVLHHGFGDLDKLLLTNAQRLYERVRLNAGLEPG